MNTIQERTHLIVSSSLFKYFILSVIVASGVLIGLETYPEVRNRFADLFHSIDQIIIYIFLFEIILKLLANGKKPWVYFSDPWNVFDFVIVAICFIPQIDTHYVMVLRLARILRVFRVISILPKLQILVNALLKSIPSMGYVVVLLFLIFYIYAVTGSFLFSSSDPVHFGSLHTSMITLFKILTLEGWTDIMNIQIYGSSDPEAQFTLKPVSYASVAYFVSFILLGGMIIMNLFIGVIMNSMQESHNDLQKELTKKQQSELGTQSILSEIENKIDGMKLEIQKLKELLNK